MAHPHAPADWPVIRPQLFVGYIDALFVVAIGKGAAPADVLQIATEVGRGIDARDDGDRVIVIYHVPGDFSSDVTLIKKLSDMVRPRQAKLKQTTLGLALTTTSTVARAVFRTVLTFADLPYSYSVTSDHQSALAFLHTLMPECDATVMHEKYTAMLRRYVPTLLEK